MGDLVLTEDEVNPVMSAVLNNGLDVTALHNHFFWEQPRVFYMHVHGTGSAADLARRVKPAIDLIDRSAKGTAAAPPAASTEPAAATLDSAALAKIIGHYGGAERTGVQDHNRPARHQSARARRRDQRTDGVEHLGGIHRQRCGRDGRRRRCDARTRVTPVLKALRGNGLDVVAIHHHMTGVQPVVVFLHHYGTGPAAKLDEGVRAAVDLLGTGPAGH